MNSRDVASYVGTDPKTLRRFLRDKSSAFQPVGSGGRYEFTTDDLPDIKAGFEVWITTQKVKSVEDRPRAVARVKSTRRTQQQADADVWATEGDVVLPDIRNPRVREAVRAEANRRAARLDEMLLAAGLHISQWRERV